MSFISQVIPALRDARTPLSVGILWTITLWIGWFLIPKQHFQTKLVTDIGHSFERLPSEVLIGLGFALIYIIGIFMEMISRFFRRIIFAVLLIGAAGQLLYSVHYGGLAGGFGAATALTALYFAWSLVRHYLRSGRQLTAENLSEVLSSTFESLRNPVVIFWDRTRVLFGPESIPYQAILKREIESHYARNPQVLLSAARNLSPDLLSNVAVTMHISIERMHLLADDELRRIIEATAQETLLQYKVRRNNRLADLTRLVVVEQLQTSSDARFAFTKQVFSLDPMHESLRGRIQDATVRLRKENNELYQEYDRMAAEGEFRRGVAIPVMALVAVASITILKSLSMPITSGRLALPAVVALIIGGSIYRAGTNRVSQSLAFMYSCINLGYVGVEKRRVFGEEMFVPHETSAFVRRSEFSYRFEELRADAKLRGLVLMRRLLHISERKDDSMNE